MMWSRRRVEPYIPIRWILIFVATLILLIPDVRKLLRQWAIRGTAAAIDLTGRVRMEKGKQSDEDEEYTRTCSSNEPRGSEIPIHMKKREEQ